MTYPSHTLHTITDEQNLPFDPGEYSKFKHGSKRIARQFGHDLFHSFMPLLVDYIQQHGPKEIVLLSSPYEHIPTASHALRDYFMQRLNVFLSVNKLPLALDSKFYRYQQYSDDFSAMNVEERRQALLQDFYYVDREFFENRLLLCIDDVRITGTHERQIQSIFTQQEITSDAFFLYFATLSNPAI